MNQRLTTTKAIKSTLVGLKRRSPRPRLVVARIAMMDFLLLSTFYYKDDLGIV